MKHAMVLLALLLANASAWAGRYIGRVVDDITRDPLPGVLVQSESREKCETDSSGGFVLDTENPRVRLTRSGFNEQWATLEPNGNTLSLRVKGLYEITAVNVKAKPDAKRAIVSKQQVSEIAVKQTTTALFPDVARVIQTMPGVTTDNDFSGLLYVRGGNPDEVAAILDDMIIMNPYLWGGRLSIFNPNLVENVEFYAGGYPAEANQALSALLDVKNKTGNPEKYSGLLDFSAATADVVLDGPLGLGDQSSFILGLRRTHYDLVMKLFSSGNVVYPFFYDGQLKLNFPGPVHTLTLQSLFSVEGMDLQLSEAEGYGEDHRADTRFHYLQRRSNTSLRVESRLTPAISVMTLVGVRVEDGFFNFSDFYTPQDVKMNQVFLQARHVWEILIADQQILKTGFYALTGQGRAQVDNIVKIATLNGYYVDHIAREFIFSWPLFLGAFIQDDVELADGSLIVSPGFNTQFYSGNHEWVASPRLAVKWKIRPDVEGHAAAGVFQQHPMETELLDENYGNPSLRAQEAIHYILGTKVDWTEDFSLAAEVFYKDYRRLTVSDPDPAVNYTNQGEGYAYGLDLILQKKLGGDWDGWLTYSYLVSRRRILERSRPENFGMNPGLEPVQEWTVAPNERPHCFNLVLNCRIGEGYKLALTQKYMTGKPYTPVVGADYQAVIDEYVPRYGQFNSERQPDYYSTDLKLTMPFFGLPGWSSYIQASNIFDVKNVDNYYYNKDFSQRKALYQLPRMIIGGIKWEF